MSNKPMLQSMAGRPLRRFRWAAIVTAVALGLSACGSGPSSAPPRHAAAQSGGTAVFAEQPGSTPNYIFPLYSLAYWFPANMETFIPLLYRPLYWYGSDGKPDLDPERSLAYPPRYSDGNRTVTITLKHWTWSDGRPVTSRDVEFWINLLRADKTGWGPYVPGTFPDNVASVDYPNASTVVIHLNRAYNPTWFTYTGLSMITPIPQHVWDRTSASGPVGNYDRTPKGAVAVYNFLNGQAKNVKTYAGNPLWRVVDGAWRLTQFTQTGEAVLVRNTHYTGSEKPHLNKVVELPFTTGTSEWDELLSGKIDYGYVPVSDIKAANLLKSRGYRVLPWVQWGMNYLYVNYSDPVEGPVLSQLYVRQAMQHLIDQSTYSRVFFDNYAYPSYGPVPTRPRTKFLSVAEEKNIYPYDPREAVSLLASHGWHVQPGGTTRCVDPSKCGPGIAAGTPIDLKLTYPSGFPEVKGMIQAIQSSFSRAGIKVVPGGLPINGIGAMLGTCHKGRPCPWDLIDYYVGFYYAPAPFPDGGPVFGTGVTGINGYDNPRMDAMIQAARTGTGLGPLHAYENYAAKQIPGLWIPMPYYQISAVKNTLQGVTPQNPLGGIQPGTWYLTK